VDSESYLRAAEELSLLAAEEATEAERSGRLSDRFVTGLAEHGLAAMALPSEMGGPGMDPAILLRVLETLGRGDGSAGWVAMVMAVGSIAGCYMGPDGATEVFAGGASSLTAGVFAPRGTARAVPGGYRVDGRWPFASGCLHAEWLSVGVRVEGEDSIRFCYLPVGETEILPTWDVGGLRATGSHDLVVTDGFVPSRLTYSLDGQVNTRDPVARLPLYGLLAAGIAAVTLGIARASIDALVELASAKTPTGSRRLLAERPSVQERVGRAEAGWEAARGFLLGVASGLAAAEPTLRDRARLRLAANHAVASAVDVVDAMYAAAGGTSVYNSSPLQRYFRDIHTATQHMMVAQPIWELAGRVLMRLPADTSQL
jgi:alkylation response protein AidB-like acyl-CoA dehydrogenase